MDRTDKANTHSAVEPRHKEDELNERFEKKPAVPHERASGTYLFPVVSPLEYLEPNTLVY